MRSAAWTAGSRQIRPRSSAASAQPLSRGFHASPVSGCPPNYKPPRQCKYRTRATRRDYSAAILQQRGYDEVFSGQRARSLSAVRGYRTLHRDVHTSTFAAPEPEPPPPPPSHAGPGFRRLSAIAALTTGGRAVRRAAGRDSAGHAGPGAGTDAHGPVDPSRVQRRNRQRGRAGSDRRRRPELPVRIDCPRVT